MSLLPYFPFCVDCSPPALWYPSLGVMLIVLSLTGNPPGILGLTCGTSPFRIVNTVGMFLVRLFAVGPAWISTFNGMWFAFGMQPFWAPLLPSTGEERMQRQKERFWLKKHARKHSEVLLRLTPKKRKEMDFFSSSKEGTVEPPLSDPLVGYESLDHIGSKSSLISIRWLKRLIPGSNTLFMWKVNLKKKSGTTHWEISISCTNQDTIMLQHVLFNFHSIICPLVAYGRLKMKEKFQIFSSISGCAHLQVFIKLSEMHTPLEAVLTCCTRHLMHSGL